MSKGLLTFFNLLSLISCHKIKWKIKDYDILNFVLTYKYLTNFVLPICILPNYLAADCDETLVSYFAYTHRVPIPKNKTYFSQHIDDIFELEVNN